MNEDIIKEYIKTGKIAANISKYVREIVKPNVPVLEIAEKIESKIIELNAKPAFPVDVSCNEIAAHYSPFWQDKNLAEGLVKVDFGVSINGYIIDNALSFDLTAEQKYKELIKASEKALDVAINLIKNRKENDKQVAVREIGKEIYKVIVSYGFSPVRNLSGHELKQYNLHAGLTIPNYDNGNNAKLQEGVYAIEPFATPGVGLVQESKPSGVYQLSMKKAVRDAKTREILQFIESEYKTLPFAARWLIKRFGLRALLSLEILEQQGCLHQFPQLVEKSRMPVSQAEKTILLVGEKIIVLEEDK